MPLVESRYAEALVDIAVREGKLDDFQVGLEGVYTIYTTQKNFKDFLLNPEVKREVKKDFIKKIFGAELNKELTSFLLLLLDKGRFKFLPGIIKEFEKLADKKRNRLVISISSAKELERNQIHLIEEKYKLLYKATTVKSTFKTDGSLIGGVKVIIGDRVVDGTIKGRLEELRKLMVSG